ncbi:MAG: hypothetical protein ISR58_03340 [Anaerolineales bacterium]|nr:hypothetical protein [Chloroflexota bacterium]MBL6980206.1 hypothetical protein [Anaerolineales bacterium]
MSKNYTLNNRRVLPIIHIYFLAAILEGIAAIVIIFQEPSDISFLFGLSKTRLILAAGIIVWVAANSLILVKLYLDDKQQTTLLARIYKISQNNVLYGILIGAGFLGFIFSSQLWHLARTASDSYVMGYLGRLIPLLILTCFFSLQNIVLLPLIRYGGIDLREMVSGKLLRLIGFLFGLLLFLWALIVLTRLGLTPDQIGWDPPGVPVIAVQVWLTCLIGILFLGLEHIFDTSEKPRYLLLDIAISFLILGVATYLWSQQPLAPDYFALAPQAPNFEIYPYSDAATHDVLAQRLVVGEGFQGIARKPFYVIFLATLHALAGQSYERVVFLQVMVIALIPVGIYWLTKSLHLRLSGVIAAVLIILRERNAIVISGKIGVSHAKLLMSDLPATLGIVLLTWMIVAWMSKPQSRRIYPLGIGGILGFLLLIRPQIVIFLPAVVVLLGILFFRNITEGLKNLALMGVGLAIVLAPWLWRSYQLSGEFVLNDPLQNAFLTQQYSHTPGYGRVKRLPGETDGEYAHRIDEYISDFITNNPGVVAGFIASHFSHNVVEMMITLPMSPWIVQNAASDLFPYWAQQSDRLWDDCCSPPAYVSSMPFWDQWTGTVTGEMIFSTALNLALLAVGLGVAFRKRDIVGWIPLGVSLVYVLSTSVGRYSGWRLILPADWVLFLYFAIGLGQVVLWLLFYLTRKNPSSKNSNQIENTWKQLSMVQSNGNLFFQQGIILGIILLGLGFSPLLFERFVPPRYAEAQKNDVLVEVKLVSNVEQYLPSIEKLLDDERSVVFEGRALYPRFYKRGDGEPGGDWPAFSPRDYSRLGFVVVGPHQHNIVFPLDESPAYFPHASDVIVIGCRAEDHISARVVVIMDDGEYTLAHLPTEELTCSLFLP